MSLENRSCTLLMSVSSLRNDNTYTDSTDGRSAADKVVSAVKAYVTNYNNVVTTAKDCSSYRSCRMTISL